MRLSESLEKNIIESYSGRIVNKFKVRKRRSVFFFDDIILDYVRLCEQRGYGSEIEDISCRWGFMLFEKTVSPLVKRIPPNILLNIIMKELFRHMGYMDNFHFFRAGDTITLDTKNERNVKTIGVNKLHVGLYEGILSSVFKIHVKAVDATQIGNGDCKYTFRMTKAPFVLESKDKASYDTLNSFEDVSGSTIKDALKSNIFVLKGNSVYFRERPITGMENTLFHLLGSKRILFEELPGISHGYFSKMVKGKSSDEEKLQFLKSLLQMMGWGVVSIIYDNKQITFQINYPPYGFQREDDNWDFLLNVILGYLWMLDKNFMLKETKVANRKLFAVFAPGSR